MYRNPEPRTKARSAGFDPSVTAKRVAPLSAFQAGSIKWLQETKRTLIANTAKTAGKVGVFME
jgi:hypothetical protein